MKQKRIDSLECLRALAFIGVFTLHGGISMCGALGVSIFIMLSGFVLVYSSKDIPCSFKENIRFSINKITKLYALHILMMLLELAYIFNAIVRDSDKQLLLDTIINIVLHVFLIQVWVPLEKHCWSLNGPIWYLSLMLFLYFVFPYILKLIKRIKTKKNTLINYV